jgi:HlyD family secretion protein
MHCTSEQTGNSPDVSQRVSGKRILILCVASLAAGIAATQWLEHRKMAPFVAVLQSKAATIVSQRPARIQSIKVSIGQRIVPGDALMELSDDLLAAQITEKQRSLAEMEVELDRVKATADVELEWRQRDLNGEIFQTQLKLSAISQERVARQVEQLAWHDRIKAMQNRAGSPVAEVVLPVRSIVSESPLLDDQKLQAMVKEDAAALAAETLANQLVLCEEQLVKLHKLEKDLPAKVRVSSGVELGEARVTRIREELAALKQQQETLTVSSISHGIVGTIHPQSGDLVRAGDPLVEVLDDDRRHLIAYIPSSFATRLHVGTKVELIFPGKQIRTGLVSAIPPHAIPAERGALTSDSQVEVTIEPSGKLWPKLPVGSRVQVKVLN